MSKKQQYKDVLKVIRKQENKKRINLTVNRRNYEEIKKKGYNVSELLDGFLEYLAKKVEKEDKG